MYKIQLSNEDIMRLTDVVGYITRLHADLKKAQNKSSMLKDIMQVETEMRTLLEDMLRNQFSAIEESLRVLSFPDPVSYDLPSPQEAAHTRTFAQTDFYKRVLVMIPLDVPKICKDEIILSIYQKLVPLEQQAEKRSKRKGVRLDNPITSEQPTVHEKTKKRVQFREEEIVEFEPDTAENVAVAYERAEDLIAHKIMRMIGVEISKTKNDSERAAIEQIVQRNRAHNYEGAMSALNKIIEDNPVINEGAVIIPKIKDTLEEYERTQDIKVFDSLFTHMGLRAMAARGEEVIKKSDVVAEEELNIFLQKLDDFLRNPKLKLTPTFLNKIEQVLTSGEAFLQILTHLNDLLRDEQQFDWLTTKLRAVLKDVRTNYEDFSGRESFAVIATHCQNLTAFIDKQSAERIQQIETFRAEMTKFMLSANNILGAIQSQQGPMPAFSMLQPYAFIFDDAFNQDLQKIRRKLFELNISAMKPEQAAKVIALATVLSFFDGTVHEKLDEFVREINHQKIKPQKLQTVLEAIQLIKTNLDSLEAGMRASFTDGEAHGAMLNKIQNIHAQVQTLKKTLGKSSGLVELLEQAVASTRYRIVTMAEKSIDIKMNQFKKLTEKLLPVTSVLDPRIKNLSTLKDAIKNSLHLYREASATGKTSGIKFADRFDTLREQCDAAYQAFEMLALRVISLNSADLSTPEKRQSVAESLSKISSDVKLFENTFPDFKGWVQNFSGHVYVLQKNVEFAEKKSGVLQTLKNLNESLVVLLAPGKSVPAELSAEYEKMFIELKKTINTDLDRYETDANFVQTYRIAKKLMERMGYRDLLNALTEPDKASAKEQPSPSAKS